MFLSLSRRSCETPWVPTPMHWDPHSIPLQSRAHSSWYAGCLLTHGPVDDNQRWSVQCIVTISLKQLEPNHAFQLVYRICFHHKKKQLPKSMGPSMMPSPVLAEQRSCTFSWVETHKVAKQQPQLNQLSITWLKHDPNFTRMWGHVG